MMNTGRKFYPDEL